VDLNHRPAGYEPAELPSCSTPRPADYRILVTGSREFTDYGMVLEAIEHEVWVRGAYWASPRPTRIVIVTGHARGADLLAERAGREVRHLPGYLEFVIEPHPVLPWEWKLYGKRAGHIRNQAMVDLGADICLAFFHELALNAGTRDCVECAEQADIPVRKFYGN
jgi:hypothetical protein